MTAPKSGLSGIRWTLRTIFGNGMMLANFPPQYKDHETCHKQRETMCAVEGCDRPVVHDSHTGNNANSTMGSNASSSNASPKSNNASNVPSNNANTTTNANSNSMYRPT
ncbi:hypothetical protein BDR05DRAFT_1007020 [Suillus weaverae]|nr:hypothetical protein BDR05DRAFT_1007020 [Suillus weaverae]